MIGACDKKLGSMKREKKGERRKPNVSSPVVKPGLHVGTSGWSYGEWDQVFYPAKVKSTQDRLRFYAQLFGSSGWIYPFLNKIRILSLVFFLSWI